MSFKQRILAGEKLAGAFVKTPSSEVIEIFALGGVDFICLDAEHSSLGRRELDWCLALARALKLPALVRLPHAGPEAILQALDAGAVGLVVPHVRTRQQALEVARWAHFGNEGRGYAGSTRSAGFTTLGMDEVLKAGLSATFVMAQIEDPSAMHELDEIAATEGIDALFFGAADFAVGLGANNSSAPAVQQAYSAVLAAAERNAKAVAGYCANAAGVNALYQKGVSLAFVGSDQSMVLAGAKEIASAARGSA